MKIRNPFKRKNRGNNYQVVAENQNDPLKSLVRFNGNYVMWLGTAQVNLNNPLPVEEWFAEHFMFKDGEGNIYKDESAGLRYSNNMKFKFAPMMVDEEEPQEEQTQEEKDEIFNRSYELPKRDTMTEEKDM